MGGRPATLVLMISDVARGAAMTPTTIRRIAVRTGGLTLVVTGTIVMVAGPPAAAAEVAPPSLSAPALTPAQMRLDIVDVRGIGFHVCAFGTAAAPGTWSLAADGARSNGTTLNVGASTYGTAWTTNNCIDVTENATLSGEFNVRFTFTPTSGRPAVALGGGTWDLLGGEHSWDTAS
jgi:hypothetical protein